MPRLAIPVRDDVHEASKPILDAVQKQFGVVPNMLKKATQLADTSVALNRRRFSLGLPLLIAGAAAPQEVVAAKASSRDEAPIVTYYRTKTIDGMKIFYREAGPANAPVVLLLHGFPTSSHMFRNLIPELADRYHVIAPDYPGVGQSDMPDRATFSRGVSAILPGACRQQNKGPFADADRGLPGDAPSREGLLDHAGSAASELRDDHLLRREQLQVRQRKGRRDHWALSADSRRRPTFLVEGRERQGGGQLSRRRDSPARCSWSGPIQGGAAARSAGRQDR